MNKKINVVERAFELARSSQCKTVTEVAIKLRREGYQDAHLHLAAKGLSKQLRELIRAHGPSLTFPPLAGTLERRVPPRKTLSLFISAD